MDAELQRARRDGDAEKVAALERRSAVRPVPEVQEIRWRDLPPWLKHRFVDEMREKGFPIAGRYEFSTWTDERLRATMFRVSTRAHGEIHNLEFAVSNLELLRRRY